MNVLLLNASPRPAGIVSQALDAAASMGPAGRSGNGQGRALPCAASPPARDVCAAARPASVRCARARRTSWAKRPPRRPARRRDTDLLGRDGRAAETALRTARARSSWANPRAEFRSRVSKGGQAVVIAACTTPWPFNLLFRQSRGAVRSVREVLSTGGMRIRSVEIAGTKALDGHLPEAARRKIERLVERALKTK